MGRTVQKKLSSRQIGRFFFCFFFCVTSAIGRPNKHGLKSQIISYFQGSILVQSHFPLLSQSSKWNFNIIRLCFGIGMGLDEMGEVGQYEWASSGFRPKRRGNL
jgi:hypothetical protein